MSGSADQLKTIIGLAIEDENFRHSLLINPKGAINSNKGKVGFDYDQMSDQAKETLATFTPEELDTLRRIYVRASRIEIPLKPPEML